MAVGLNAKIPHTAPEAAPATAGDKSGEGEGFAQMLTGIVSSPPATPASGAKGIESDVAAQALDISPAPAAPAQAVAVAALQIFVAPQGLEGVVPDRTKQTPVNPELPRCMVDLGDLATKLAHLERALGVPDQDPKASPEADDDTDADDQSAPAEDHSLAAALTAALTGTAQAPAAATSGAEVAKTDSASSAALPTTPAAKDGAGKVAIQLGAAKDERAAKAQDLLKSLQPVKPFELPPQLRSMVQAGFAFDKGTNSPADAAQAALAALNRSSDSTADAPLAAAPAPAVSPLFGASVQVLVQPQLAADALGATDVAGSDGASTPDTNQLGIDRQLDIARDNQWLDRLAKDISRSAGQEGTLKFKLNPETLGSLHVEIAQSHAGTSVRLTTDTEAARTIIADAQPRLIAEARAQGVRIAEAHVGLNSNGDQRRQDDSRQEAFVRTARPAETEVEQPRQSSSAAAERFA